MRTSRRQGAGVFEENGFLGRVRQDPPGPASGAGLGPDGTYRGDTDAAFSSRGRADERGSKFIGNWSEGQMYVAQITITETAALRIHIVNKDLTKAKPGEYYAITLADTIEAPGKILAYTFFHELIHLKYRRRPLRQLSSLHHEQRPERFPLCDDGDHKAPPRTSCGARSGNSTEGPGAASLTRKAKIGRSRRRSDHQGPAAEEVGSEADSRAIGMRQGSASNANGRSGNFGAPM